MDIFRLTITESCSQSQIGKSFDDLPGIYNASSVEFSNTGSKTLIPLHRPNGSLYVEDLAKSVVEQQAVVVMNKILKFH